MQDRLASIEQRLTSIEERLDQLEGTASTTATQREQTSEQGAFTDGFVANASVHVGRVLLIFGGAYLLRAITDFEFVPTAVGLALGAVYALYWLFVAWRRAAEPTQRAAAAFFGATSVLLMLPLIVEAATTFGLLSGVQALAAAGVYFGLALSVAVQRELRTLAWLVTGGACATALALLIATHAAIAAAVLMLAVALASLWAVYNRGWLALQWLGAAGAALAAVALITLSHSQQWSISAGSASVYASFLLVSYLVSFALRSELQLHDVGIFEAVQAPLAGGLARWAAAKVDGSAAVSTLAPTGLFAILVGVVAYGIALHSRARCRHRRNFYYYSALGLLFIVAGTAIILPTPVASALWSVMAIALAWVSGRRGWVSLSLQCTVLLIVAGLASGLLATGLSAFAGDPVEAWPAVSPWLIGTAAATVVCLFLPVAQHSERWGMLAGLPQLIVLALSVWEVGGLIVLLAGPIFAGAGSDAANLAVLAALRTVVLATASVTLALSSRFARWPEARWLVYPVLLIVALKVFAEDFPNGQPVTLFVALAFVGGALLAVARLLTVRDAEASPQ